MTGHCVDTQRLYAGAAINAVKAQSIQAHLNSKVGSRVQGEARPKRSRHGQDSYESAVPAKESKSKKVRFTEPLQDIGHAHCTLSSTQEQISKTAATHRQAADDSDAARCSKTPAQAATKRRGNSRKQLTANAARQAGASAEASAPKPTERTSPLEPVKTRAATRAAAVARPNSKESATAAARPKTQESVAAATRPKRKQVATAASTEDEQFSFAKRARADGAESSFTGRTVPRPLA